MLPIKEPADRYPYDPLPESRPFDASVAAGVYVYVQDRNGTV
jgi:hypothetical protein